MRRKIKINWAVFLCHRFFHKQKSGRYEIDDSGNGFMNIWIYGLFGFFLLGIILLYKWRTAYDSVCVVLF